MKSPIDPNPIDPSTFPSPDIQVDLSGSVPAHPPGWKPIDSNRHRIDLAGGLSGQSSMTPLAGGFEEAPPETYLEGHPRTKRIRGQDHPNLNKNKNRPNLARGPTTLLRGLSGWVPTLLGVR